MGYYITPKTVIVVGSVLPGLASIAVISRFFVRSKQATRYGVDDWLILASLFFTVACGISMVVGSAIGGLAQPTPRGDGPMGYFTVKNHALVVTEKVNWIDMLLQCLSFGFVKLSVVYFYRRIFCNPASRGGVFDIISKITIVFIILWMSTFFFVILFECKGHWWAQWDTLQALLTHCLDDSKIQLVFSYMDVISDAWILSLPLYPVWKLRMSAKRRLAVCAVFLMGVLAVVAGVVRLIIYVQQLAHSYQDPDGIKVITTQLYWSLIEMGLCDIAACLPTLKPLFSILPTDSLFGSLRSLFTSKSSGESKLELSKLPATHDTHDHVSQHSQKSLV